MSKTLFDSAAESFAPTNAGRTLENRTLEFVTALMKEYVYQGYSPREVSVIMHGAVSLAESTAALRAGLETRKTVTTRVDLSPFPYAPYKTPPRAPAFGGQTDPEYWAESAVFWREQARVHRIANRVMWTRYAELRAEEFERLVAACTPVENQCDGCRRGLPLENGIHRGTGTWDMIGCTADRYLK